MLLSDFITEDIDALIELGKGNVAKLARIKETFEETSMVPMADRKYIEKLAAEYLSKLDKNELETTATGEKPVIRVHKTKRHPQSQKRKEFVKKEEVRIEEIKKQPKIESFDEYEKEYVERMHKVKDVSKYVETEKTKVKEDPKEEFPKEEKIDESKKQKKKSSFEDFEREYVERVHQGKNKQESESKKNEIENIESPREEPTESEIKPHKHYKKKIAVLAGILVVITIATGVIVMTGSIDSLSISGNASQQPIERESCDDNVQLVKSTKILGFPDPEKNLQYYVDRYNNEPSYREWFDKNFPGELITNVLMAPSPEKTITISGFPDPEKDLQYYVDRYNNEPSYREWFDKTFPGYTVIQAVC